MHDARGRQSRPARHLRRVRLHRRRIRLTNTAGVRAAADRAFRSNADMVADSQELTEPSLGRVLRPRRVPTRLLWPAWRIGVGGGAEPVAERCPSTPRAASPRRSARATRTQPLSRAVEFGRSRSPFERPGAARITLTPTTVLARVSGGAVPGARWRHRGARDRLGIDPGVGRTSVGRFGDACCQREQASMDMLSPILVASPAASSATSSRQRRR